MKLPESIQEYTKFVVEGGSLQHELFSNGTTHYSRVQYLSKNIKWMAHNNIAKVIMSKGTQFIVRFEDFDFLPYDFYMDTDTWHTFLEASIDV